MESSDTTLWRLRSATTGRITECVVRFDRSGVEVEISSDGSPVMTRLFTTGTEATAWAEDERAACDKSP